MEIRERLAVFYARLQSAPPAETAEGAFRLICLTLEEVEREFAPVPKTEPPPKTFDGRMYIPQRDNIEKTEKGSIWIKTRRHRILIHRHGGFVIFREMPDGTLFEEFRKDGGSE